MKKNSKFIVVIRLRGTARIKPKIEKTFESLNLRKKFNATIFNVTDSMKGMLVKAKDWITWGEINQETLKLLLQKRGRIKGGKKFDESFIKVTFNKNGFEDFSKAIFTDKISLIKLKQFGFDPVFRLHPPKGGFKGSIKYQFNIGGELGYRGDTINDLVKKML